LPCTDRYLSLKGLALLPFSIKKKATNTSFALDVPWPDIITLYAGGKNRGDPMTGALQFPEMAADDPCRMLDILPKTSLEDDLPISAYYEFPVIAFAPWQPDCNKRFLDSAEAGRSNIQGFLFYDLKNMDRLPSADNEYWSGRSFRRWSFPVYVIRGREGSRLMEKYAEYTRDKTMVSDIHGLLGRARIYLEFNTGARCSLPGLWLFLLLVLAVLLATAGLISISMHLLQCQRRRSLRRRIARGEVDLEALGIKRVVVPRKFLDKLPVRKFIARPSSGHSKLAPTEPISTLLSPSSSEPWGQPSCVICLEDFVSQVTIVRELPCKHIFHPICIDGFLESQSSLCPLCKSSTLPKGYLPPDLTNMTVRRERLVRRERARIAQEQAAVHSSSSSSSGGGGGGGGGGDGDGKRIRITSWLLERFYVCWNPSGRGQNLHGGGSGGGRNIDINIPRDEPPGKRKLSFLFSKKSKKKRVFINMLNSSPDVSNYFSGFLLIFLGRGGGGVGLISFFFVFEL
jgi:hypothetical protein